MRFDLGVACEDGDALVETGDHKGKTDPGNRYGCEFASENNKFSEAIVRERPDTLDQVAHTRGQMILDGV